MSTRTYLLAIESLEAIRNSIGSGTQHILDGLLAKLDKGHPDYVGYAKSMIMGPERAKEPGCWNYLIHPLAIYLGLQIHRLSLSEWKQYDVWKLYRAKVNSQISIEARRLLKLLESGRAFRGKAIAHDGCMFAWLSGAEVTLLHSQLAPLEIDECDDLELFHAQLVDSLSFVATNRMELFLGAH